MTPKSTTEVTASCWSYCHGSAAGSIGVTQFRRNRYSHHSEIRDVPLMIVKALPLVAMKESNQFNGPVMPAEVGSPLLRGGILS